jgi:phage-related protein
MAEQTIDKLQIEIESNADAAGKGMERICASIKKLSSAVRTGIPGLEQLSRQMEEFSARTAPLGKAFSQIDSPLARLKSSFSGVSTPLGRLKDAFSRIVSPVQRMKESMSGMSVQNFANSIRALEGMGNSLQNIQALGKGFNSLSNALSKLNGINVGQTAQQLQQIAFAVGPLADGVGKSTSALSDFGKGMNSLTSSLKRLNTIDLGETAQKVREMSVALRPLTDEMLRAGPAAASYGENMRNLAQAMRTASNAGTLTRSLAENTKQLSGITSFLNFGKLAAGFYALKRAGEFLGGFIQNTNSYIEDMNLFAVSMGEAAAEGRELAGRMEELLGIDAGEAMRSMGVFRQMTTSFGVAGEQATLLSKNLTQLTYDMSSFYNIDAADAFLKLRSGIAGEAEPLRALGVDISNARLQQELWNLGINASVEGLNQADKALLRYTAIMNQTANAQGDMARTLSSPANQLRVLEAQLGLASRAIGSIFIPALNAVLPYAIAFVKVVRMAAESLASFFGFQMPDVDYSGISAGLGDISSGLDDTASSAASAGKQLKKLISGFDELNIFQENSAAGAVGGAIGGNILGDLDLSGYDMFEGLVENNVEQLVDRISAAFGRLKQTLDSMGLQTIKENFLSFFETLKQQAAEFNFGDAIKQALESGIGLAMSSLNLGQNVMFPILQALNLPSIGFEAINTLTALFNGLKSAVDAVTPGITNFVQIGLVPIAEWVGGKIADGLQSLQDLFNGIGQWFTDHEEMFTTLGTSLGELTSNIWTLIEPIADSAWDTFKQIIGKLVEFFGKLVEHLTAFIQPMIDATSATAAFLDEIGAFDIVGDIFSTEFSGIGNIISGFLDTLGGVLDFLTGIFSGDWDKAWQGIKEIFSGVITAITGIFEMMLPGFSEQWDSFKTGFSEDWDQRWNAIKTGASQIWDAMGTSWDEKINAIGTFFSTFSEDFSKGWDEFWNGVSKVLDDILDGMKKLVRDAVNWILDRLREVIQGARRIASAVGDFFGFDSGSSYSRRTSYLQNFTPYAIPDIPQMAAFSAAPAAVPAFSAVPQSAGSYVGVSNAEGIVSSMQARIAQHKTSSGGANEEALRSFGMDLIQALMQMQNQQEERPIELHVTIGDKEVGQPAARWMRQQERISGVNPGKL